MKIRRFEELLDQYGWDLASWPEHLQRDANKLIADDAHAAKLLRSLRAVEDILADDPLPMGKHRAIDDIFAAIDTEEKRRPVESHSHNPEPNDIFKSIDDRPRSRAYVSHSGGVPHRDLPVRRSYRQERSFSPAESLLGKGDNIPLRHSKGILGLITRQTFPRIGMAICILAGFIAGVTMTVQQGLQLTAQAGYVPIVDVLENHLYDIEGAGKARDPQFRGAGALNAEHEGDLK